MKLAQLQQDVQENNLSRKVKSNCMLPSVQYNTFLLKLLYIFTFPLILLLLYFLQVNTDRIFLGRTRSHNSDLTLLGNKSLKCIALQYGVQIPENFELSFLLHIFFHTLLLSSFHFKRQPFGTTYTYKGKISFSLSTLTSRLQLINACG